MADHADIDHTGIPGVSSGSGIAATIFDAKGDLIAASAADTAARLATSTNGYVLTPASGETTGLKWAPTGLGHGAVAYNSAANANGGVDSAITLNSEEADTDAYHDTGSATARLTVPSGLGGWYYIFAGSFDSSSAAIYLRLDGTTKVRGARSQTGTGLYHNVTALQFLTATQYVEMIGSTSATYGDNSDRNAQSTLGMVLIGS